MYDSGPLFNSHKKQYSFATDAEKHDNFFFGLFELLC